MQIQLIRHATLRLEFGGATFLVDPMLDDAGARPAIENSPNPRPNPTVSLPLPAADVIRGVDAVLVTHTHTDHWDATAARLLPKDLPLLGQPEDQAKFQAAGFSASSAVDRIAGFRGVQITRTGGRHGTGRIARMLAPVSGFILRAPGEPTLYIAGDTIWCDEVATALRVFSPAVTVVNAGGARFLEGDTITMSPDDVVAVCRAAPATRIVAVHMEAINHCLVTRDDLAFQLDAARLRPRVSIPEDGEHALVT